MKLSIYFLSVFLPFLISIGAVEKKRLCDYGANVYSQFGEDAVLQNIFRELAWKQASRDKLDKIPKHAGFRRKGESF